MAGWTGECSHSEGSALASAGKIVSISFFLPSVTRKLLVLTLGNGISLVMDGSLLPHRTEKEIAMTQQTFF